MADPAADPEADPAADPAAAAEVREEHYEAKRLLIHVIRWKTLGQELEHSVTHSLHTKRRSPTVAQACPRLRRPYLVVARSSTRRHAKEVT